MRRPDLILIMIGAVTLAATAYAQDVPPPPDVASPTEDAMTSAIEDAALTPEQQMDYDTWPPDRRMVYNGWPTEVQSYFWSLPPERQALFWRVNDTDREMLSTMSAPDQEASWKLLEKRAAEPAPEE